MKSFLIIFSTFCLSTFALADALGFGISRSYFGSQAAVLPREIVGHQLNCSEHMANGKTNKLTIEYLANGYVRSSDDFINESKFTFGPYSREVSASKLQTYPVGTGSIRIPGYVAVYTFMNARQVADTIFIELGLYPSSKQQNNFTRPISDMPKGSQVLSYYSCSLNGIF